MQREVDKAPEDYILNVNETEYLNYLTDKYSVEPPTLDFDAIYGEDYEKEVPVPDLLARYSGNEYVLAPRAVYKFFIPYAGNIQLIEYPRSSMQMWAQDMFIEGPTRCVGFEVVSHDVSPETVNRERESVVRSLKQEVGGMADQIQAFNASVRPAVEQAFRGRKDRILKRLQMNEAITVPIKKRDDLPSTFAIPTPPFQRSATARPMVTERGYKAEPNLDKDTYHDILRTIFDVGQEIERHPAVYAGMKEETLRDIFLIFLAPRHPGSTTGETFNKGGKTDILMRYQNQNIFVAECKFWKGAQKYSEAIDQLLGYLTWRDSKAAIILFVRSEKLSDRLRTIEEATPKHPNYLGFVGKEPETETWFNYRLHIRGDRNREVKLAVLVLHIPQGVDDGDEAPENEGAGLEQSDRSPDSGD